MTTTDTHLDPGAVRSVLSGERPPRPGPVSTSGTFWWRAMLKIKHVPEQLFDVTAFPVIFLLMFTYLFGGALAGSTGAYLQQVLPGILVMTVTWITLYTGLNLNRDIHRGIDDRFRSLPIWRPATIVGPLLADAVRYTLASLVILGLGLALGFRPGAGVVGVVQALALLLVFSFALSWIWTLLGLVVRSDNALLGIGNMVMFPVTFVSNVFVAPETLPGWLEGFVQVNPVTTLVSAMRGLIHGGTDVGGDVLAVLLISAGLVAVFGPLTMLAYRRRS
ncbi:ABC transporter permease [Cellulomonas carbonis]|uniref:Transport permease protein n=1 Tax=Cellulomonas carbonis T26 TaxID=947969 RepID=A0A0A0BPN9_9CELL|nr:ABC transporter permease [Cellulomonas carbonis]KGM09049.1 ABC transporter [Cellulomonas carbonis T26]MDT0167238.1 ABC transporter permease [Actinotalea sp. AC32]GGC05804.1 transport permease protein [Cellulomonas carbonis]